MAILNTIIVDAQVESLLLGLRQGFGLDNNEARQVTIGDERPARIVLTPHVITHFSSPF